MKRRRRSQSKELTAPLTEEERARRHEHSVRLRAYTADGKVRELQEKLRPLQQALDSFARSRGTVVAALPALREEISAKYWQRERIQAEIAKANAMIHRVKEELARIEAEDGKKQALLSYLLNGYQPSKAALERIELCRKKLADTASAVESKREELRTLEDTTEEREFASTFDRAQGIEKEIRQYESAVRQAERLDEREQMRQEAENRRREAEAMKEAIVAVFFNAGRQRIVEFFPPTHRRASCSPTRHRGVEIGGGAGASGRCYVSDLATCRV